MFDRDNKTPIEFVTPSSISDGEEKRRFLAEEIGDIAQQLNARRQEVRAKFAKRHPNGTRGPWDVTPEERTEIVAHEAWRNRALGDLRIREKVLRQLNDWLKEARRKAYTEAGQPLKTPPSTRILRAAYDLFLRLHKEEVEFDHDEWQVIEALGKCIHGDENVKPSQ